MWLWPETKNFSPTPFSKQSLVCLESMEGEAGAGVDTGGIGGTTLSKESDTIEGLARSLASLCCRPTALEGLITVEDVVLDDEVVDEDCFDIVAVVLPVVVVVVAVVGLLEAVVAAELVAVDLDLVAIVDVGSFDLDMTALFLLTTCLLELVALFKPKAAVLVADAGRAEGLLVVREILVEDDEEALETLAEAPTMALPPELPIVR